jgi:F-type H+-transporting ATPase subunit a
MMVGHTMLKVFAGFVTLLGIFGVAPLVFIAVFVGFELFVATLQAYIFAVLSCLYLHDALHPQH